MYFNKLLLKDFGKFHNKEISLKPGVNVVHGTRNAGKSTIGDFVYSMMYGVSQSPESKADDLRHQKPMDGRDFAGKAHLHKDGKDYLVERSFLKGNATTQIMEIQTGKVAKMKNKNTLYQSFTDIDKKSYSDALYVRQHKDHMNQAEELNAFVVNVATTGSSNLDKRLALATLKEKKSAYDMESVDAQIADIENEMTMFEGDEEKLSCVRKEIEDTKQELSVETARRKREARRLIDVSKQAVKDDDEVDSKEPEEKKTDSTETSTKSEESERIFLDADLLADYKQKKPLSEQLWFISLVGVFVVAVIAALVYILPFDTGVRQLFIVCTILFVILTIIDGLHVKGLLQGENQGPSEEEFKRIVYELERKNEAYEEVEIDMSFAQAYVDKVEALRATELEILQRQQKKEQLMEELRVCKDRKRSMEREVQSITLAINTINELTREIADEHNYVLNGHSADIMTKVTGGKYQDVRIDAKLRVGVKNGGSYVDITEIPTEDFAEVRFAIHLAMARELCQENIPVIIDGIPNLSDQQLMDTMECVKTIPSDQILVLSDNSRLVSLLEETGFDYTLSNIA